jgi:hypothetical protein
MQMPRDPVKYCFIGWIEFPNRLRGIVQMLINFSLEPFSDVVKLLRNSHGIPLGIGG